MTTTRMRWFGLRLSLDFDLPVFPVAVLAKVRRSLPTPSTFPWIDVDRRFRIVFELAEIWMTRMKMF